MRLDVSVTVLRVLATVSSTIFLSSGVNPSGSLTFIAHRSLPIALTHVKTAGGHGEGLISLVRRINYRMGTAFVLDWTLGRK